MTTHPPSHDPASITRPLGRLTEAWNAGDASAYGQQFTEDATYVAFNGQVMRGRSEIEYVHRWLFEGPLRGSRLESGGSDWTPPRVIRPGVAVVLNTGGVRPEGESELDDDRRSVLTVVLVDEGDGDWRITAFQNTRQQARG